MLIISVWLLEGFCSRSDFLFYHRKKCNPDFAMCDLSGNGNLLPCLRRNTRLSCALQRGFSGFGILSPDCAVYSVSVWSFYSGGDKRAPVPVQKKSSAGILARLCPAGSCDSSGKYGCEKYSQILFSASFVGGRSQRSAGKFLETLCVR